MSHLRNLTSAILLSACSSQAAFSQAKPHYFYVADPKMYVLSETDYIEGRRQDFHSLFIWQQDRVIRVVFSYIKRSPVAFAANTYVPHSLNEFLTYAQQIKLYYRPHRVYTFGRNDYLYMYQLRNNGDGRATFGNDGYNYEVQLKYAINRWNSIYNPLADRFGHWDVHDAPSEILMRNEHRKGDYANTLPLVFKLPGSDSLCFVKPWYITIYRLQPKNASGVLPGMRAYTHYASVSLVDDSSPAYAEPVFRTQTIDRLYQADLPADTAALISRLSTLKQSPFKPNGEPTGPEVADIGPEIRIRVINGKTVQDTIKPPPPERPKPFIYCYNSFDYCQDCYDPAIPIADRLKKQCPFVVANTKPEEEYWAYALSTNGLHFFYRYNPSGPINFSVIPTPISSDYGMKYWQNWQFMCPGVGYWLANVVDKDGNVPHFYLNGMKIK